MGGLFSMRGGWDLPEPEPAFTTADLQAVMNECYRAGGQPSIALTSKGILVSPVQLFVHPDSSL